jgi:hypothetical protein
MALTLITNPPTTLAISSDWTTLVTRSNGNMLGHGLSIPIFTLTNWDGTTTRPLIAEGSIIEVGGSFYQADADTAIVDEGGISDGTVHIKLIPGAGTPDPLTVVPTLTNDALPSWDANKAGWYTGANKYLPFEMTKASAVYTVKSEYIDQNKLIKISTVGDMILSKDLTAVIGNLTTGNITTANITTNNVTNQNMTGLMKWRKYYKDSNIDANEIFDNISSWVPNVGNIRACTGHVITAGGVEGYIQGIERTATDTVRMAIAETDGSTTPLSVVDGTTTSYDDFELMANLLQVT